MLLRSSKYTFSRDEVSRFIFFLEWLNDNFIRLSDIYRRTAPIRVSAEGVAGNDVYNFPTYAAFVPSENKFPDSELWSYI